MLPLLPWYCVALPLLAVPIAPCLSWTSSPWLLIFSIRLAQRLRRCYQSSCEMPQQQAATHDVTLPVHDDKLGCLTAHPGSRVSTYLKVATQNGRHVLESQGPRDGEKCYVR